MIRKNVTRIINRMHGDLAAAFPEFSDLLAIDSTTGIAILEEYATPERMAAADPREMLQLMRKAGRNHRTPEDVEKLIRAAVTTIGIPDPDGVFAVRIQTNARRLRNELSELKRVEREMETRSSDNSDVRHLTEIKGIGPVNAAIIVSEIGSIKQFDSAVKLQSYGGKCPDITGSGGKTHPAGITRVRNKYLSNAVYESAVSLVTHRSGEFLDLFNRELVKKKSRTEAYIVVAKRLLFHVYSIMKNDRAYRERKPGKRGREQVPVE